MLTQHIPEIWHRNVMHVANLDDSIRYHPKMFKGRSKIVVPVGVGLSVDKSSFVSSTKDFDDFSKFLKNIQ